MKNKINLKHPDLSKIGNINAKVLTGLETHIITLSQELVVIMDDFRNNRYASAAEFKTGIFETVDAMVDARLALEAARKIAEQGGTQPTEDEMRCLVDAMFDLNLLRHTA